MDTVRRETAETMLLPYLDALHKASLIHSGDAEAFEHLLDADGAGTAKCREMALEYIPKYAPYHPQFCTDAIEVLLQIAKNPLSGSMAEQHMKEVSIAAAAIIEIAKHATELVPKALAALYDLPSKACNLNVLTYTLAKVNLASFKGVINALTERATANSGAEPLLLLQQILVLIKRSHSEWWYSVRDDLLVVLQQKQDKLTFEVKAVARSVIHDLQESTEHGQWSDTNKDSSGTSRGDTKESDFKERKEKEKDRDGNRDRSHRSREKDRDHYYDRDDNDGDSNTGQNKRFPPSRHLWVGNAESLTDQDLRRAFGAFGDLESVEMINNKYGFVNFYTEEEATKAKRQLQGSTIRGRKIFIHYAEAPPSKWIWIGPLSPVVTLEKLEKLLEGYGRVKHIAFFGGHSEYAVAEFHYVQEAAQAKRHLNGSVMDECKLNIGFGEWPDALHHIARRKQDHSDGYKSAEAIRKRKRSNSSEHFRSSYDHQYTPLPVEVSKDFSSHGVVDNVTIIDECGGMRIACVDFKNPQTALSAKRAMQEKGDYGTITFWEGEVSRHIWVGNIDPDVSSRDLRDEFAHYGDIQSFSRFKFHAFIDFRSEAAAVRAYNSLQGIKLGNRYISLDYARSDAVKDRHRREKYAAVDAERGSLRHNRLVYIIFPPDEVLNKKLERDIRDELESKYALGDIFFDNKNHCAEIAFLDPIYESDIEDIRAKRFFRDCRITTTAPDQKGDNRKKRRRSNSPRSSSRSRSRSRSRSSSSSRSRSRSPSRKRRTRSRSSSREYSTSRSRSHSRSQSRSRTPKRNSYSPHRSSSPPTTKTTKASTPSNAESGTPALANADMDISPAERSVESSVLPTLATTAVIAKPSERSEGAASTIASESDKINPMQQVPYQAYQPFPYAPYIQAYLQQYTAGLDKQLGSQFHMQAQALSTQGAAPVPPPDPSAGLNPSAPPPAMPPPPPEPVLPTPATTTPANNQTAGTAPDARHKNEATPKQISSSQPMDEEEEEPIIEPLDDLEPEPVWRGTLTGLGDPCPVEAFYLSGSTSPSLELPEVLPVRERTLLESVSRCMPLSRTTFLLVRPSPPEDRAIYESVYAYFLQRERAGVVRRVEGLAHGTMVYLVPTGPEGERLQHPALPRPYPDHLILAIVSPKSRTEPSA